MHALDLPGAGEDRIRLEKPAQDEIVKAPMVAKEEPMAPVGS